MDEVKKPFRVLALDGGGIRGAFSAAVLAQMQEALDRAHPGKRLVDQFDLICGTSTGGLLAIALGLGIPSAELPEMYVEYGDEIFEQPESAFGRISQIWRQVTGAKHDPVGLVNVLGEKFGDRVFGESSVRLAITAFDVTLGRIFVFKTAHDPRFMYDIDVPATQIARCTSAAPTYFPPEVLKAHRDATYVDGGVWANNPSMVGLIEAVAFCGADIGDVHVLNIGTTSAVEDFSNFDDVTWKLKLPSLLMTGPSEAAHRQTMLLLGDRFHRIDAKVPQGWASLDDTEHVEKLATAGRASAVLKRHVGPVMKLFLTGEDAPKFVPLYTPTPRA